ncbi:hypothetical protein C2S52_016450 [Perilla frutescens var. hirtella]|nr:hypothetical protein C2S52_016450 [Perilla frutescens var. hirtella]
MDTTTSDEIEITSSIPADKMFKAVALDSDDIIPKIFPGAHVEIIQGDGGPGTIKKINFGEGMLKSVKHRIDAVDKDKLSQSYTVMTSDILSSNIESIAHELTVIPSPDGGSIYKNRITNNTKLGDANIIDGAKEEATVLFKAIEDYILAHPDAY